MPGNKALSNNNRLVYQKHLKEKEVEPHVAQSQESQDRLYMDAEDLYYTDLCHPYEIGLLQSVIDKEKSIRKHRMLDAGCGDGRFLEFWAKRFDRLDLFDQSAVAIEKV